MNKDSLLIFGGIGALIGAALSTTEKGKEMEKNLRESLDFYKDNKDTLKELLPSKKITDFLEGGE